MLFSLFFCCFYGRRFGWWCERSYEPVEVEFCSLLVCNVPVEKAVFQMANKDQDYQLRLCHYHHEAPRSTTNTDPKHTYFPYRTQRSVHHHYHHHHHHSTPPPPSTIVSVILKTITCCKIISLNKKRNFVRKGTIFLAIFKGEKRMIDEWKKRDNVTTFTHVLPIYFIQ